MSSGSHVHIRHDQEGISILEVTWGAENQMLKPALKILINNAKTPIIIYNAYLIWKT